MVMQIPYDKIMAIKVLKDSLPNKGIINRLKRLIYNIEMDSVVDLILSSTRNPTSIYKQDLIKFCKFVKSVPNMDTSKDHIKINISEDVYKIIVDEGWNRYTEISMIDNQYPEFDISSSDPDSDILTNSATALVTTRSKTEKRIYDIIVDIIIGYIDM